MSDVAISVANAIQPFYSVDDLKNQATANKISDFGVHWTLGGSGSTGTPQVGSGTSDFGVSAGVLQDFINKNLGGSTGTGTTSTTGTSGVVATSAPAGTQNHMPWILGAAGVVLLGIGASVMFGDKKGKK